MNDMIVELTETATLVQRADRIRSLVNVARGCIIEVGLELICAKSEINHGTWATWLKDEFKWDERTARRYMQVAEAFKTDTLSDLEQLSITIDATALYALSAPDVPQPARDEAIERAQTGDD